MSKGAFKVTLKSCNIQKISSLFPDIQLTDPFVEIILGQQVKRSKPAENKENFILTWNDQSFSFQKTTEYTLSLVVLQQSATQQEILLGSQEIGINTFVRKLSTVDHSVVIMNQGLAVGVVVLNFEFFPLQAQPQQRLKTRINQKDNLLHKLLISKMKATIDSSDAQQKFPSKQNNRLRVQLGSRFWITQSSRTPGFNLSWQDSFTLMLQGEQEISLDIVGEEGDDPSSEQSLGNAVLKLQQIKEGSSPNRVPIIWEGSQIGFFYFQTEYQVPNGVQSISPSLTQSTPQNYSLNPRLISAKPNKNGILQLNSIKVFLENNYTAEDGFLSVQYEGQTQKTALFLGLANKLEWKQKIYFAQPQLDQKITFQLYDKHFNSDNQPLGNTVLFLEENFQEGGKFRSHKVDLFQEDHSIGQLFLDYEYVFDSIELSDQMKKISIPTPSDIKKQELLQRRKQLMRSHVVEGGKPAHFLPKLESSVNHNNSSVLSTSNNNSMMMMRTPQPIPAVKSVFAVSLPYLNYDIQVKEYNKIYTDSVFGKGMSNIHSAASLTHSIPSYSLPKADRFPTPQYHGFQQSIFKAPSQFGSNPNDPYVYSKKNIFTEDFKYKVVHRSPAQKSGASFGIGSRFQSPSQQTSPGYYQGPELFDYKKV